jgi:hypothetical protein
MAMMARKAKMATSHHGNSRQLLLPDGSGWVWISGPVMLGSSCAACGSIHHTLNGRKRKQTKEEALRDERFLFVNNAYAVFRLLQNLP